MEIVNSKKFYEDLKNGKVAIINTLTMEGTIFIEKDLVPQYIICDAEHYQYLQDELKQYQTGAMNISIFSNIIIALNIHGYLVNIIIRLDMKGINLFAKLKEDGV